MRFLITLLAFAGAVFAQHNGRVTSSYAGQSWTGLLVNAGCDTAHPRPATPADAEANLTVADRVTTPAVDGSGTRGQSQLLTQKDEADRNVLPKTGEADNGSRHSSDPSWNAARKQAAALPGSCAVDPSTTRFGLLLPNGKLLLFDDLANQGIAKQLKTKPPARKTILRVQAAGKLQGGRIALDTIQL